ncbi:hypothetical protein OVA24_09200 [Luteolibacter sp. SL250]|uniref:hypothetical protein n=1 Tax=Luteolibacter sp. SL250 TaxID=2995170 RepID=UPI002271105A|nr:hypothetical protein [Luteolibacter sp. SL250]WAC21559.1 hypothetical protein OVA24_09200 [Luteolibacter sp. SL250]
MKPLPTDSSSNRNRRVLDDLPVLQTSAGSPSNYRRTGNPIHRAYPWLLLMSTALSAGFCVLYLTKPVIQAGPSAEIVPQPEAAPKPEPVPAAPAPKAEEQKLAAQPKTPPPLLPGNRLPGESTAPKITRATRPAAATTEQTNLSVQHVLTAQIPQGDVSRIILDVPVLYNSRQLRWTQADVEEARGLLARLAVHQEQTAMLREEASGLLEDWNRLVARSIPTSELRADSPSLPANQNGSPALNVPASLDTSESIQLKPAGQ